MSKFSCSRVLNPKQINVGREFPVWASCWKILFAMPVHLQQPLVSRTQVCGASQTQHRHRPVPTVHTARGAHTTCHSIGRRQALTAIQIAMQCICYPQVMLLHFMSGHFGALWTTGTAETTCEATRSIHIRDTNKLHSYPLPLIYANF